MTDLACKIGFCDFYDNGSGVFGLVSGVVIGMLLILGFQAIGRRIAKRRDRDA